MQKKADVLVIGGGPAGVVSAVTAKQFYPDKNILLMKSIEHGCIPCGIPYMLSSLKNPDENKMGNAPLEKNNIEVVSEEATKINREKKEVTTAYGNTYGYEKLILATGSSPIIPNLPGVNKKGVYPIYKIMGYLKDFVKEIKESKSVLVIGGGFIGVEFADEISKLTGIKVYLVELLPEILINSFDSEFSEFATEKLKSKGVELITGTKVEEILGNEKVESVLLSDGRKIEVDSVILGIGAIPDTKLAIDVNLDLDFGKGIWTDEYMRTVDPDIFAVGDCAGKRDFFTRKYAPVMLASTATAEARVAGANLYELKVIKENKGTIAIYSTYIDGLVLGSAGLTESHAKREGFDVIIGEAQGIDKHPGSLPGASNIKVKLIFSRRAGIILGGQVAGGAANSELINMIGVAIQKRMSATELETLQVATHPYLTSAPTMYPIIVAAQAVSRKM
jgi:NADH oxidase (H2O2-forming)